MALLCREQLDDDVALIDSWIEAFELVQNANGEWSWDEWVDQLVGFCTKNDALLKDWNRFVPDYNAVVLPRQRPVGRPLGADEEQQRKVLDLRRQGRSLRGIAEDLELGFPTVRTIIDRYNGADRATKARWRKLHPGESWKESGYVPLGVMNRP